ILPPECSPPLDDAETTAAWMNNVVEKCIMMAPEQYLLLPSPIKTTRGSVPYLYTNFQARSFSMTSSTNP
ncbi:LpxL/LpxP family acyltransferase, partial [Escherichia coli]|uniref:LpxL/LpxP family acyltransferase n=1 Tax=Escherichia coli TaxID=562 RepID=UPI00406D2E4E